MIKHTTAAVAAALFLSGCANQPLLFTSGVTVGVDIGINGASTNPVNLTVGYKQLDGTLVPVTAVGANNAVYPIRGCNGSAAGSESAPGCAPSNSGPQANARDPHLGAAGLTLQPPAANGMQSASLRQPASAPLVLGSPPPLPPGDTRNQVDSSVDSLSVYSSFDADVNAGTGTSANAGVVFGKVFATGVAAQNLSDAQRQFATYKGMALVYGPVGTCIQQLTNALNAGARTAAVTEAMVKVCQAAAPPAPGH